jgi:tetratricopeptide (TPR) repeat protein
MDSGESGGILEGVRLVFVGRLASMPRREAAPLVRQHGAVVADKPSPAVDLVVVGEADLVSPGEEPDDWFDAATQQAIDQGHIEVLRETQLWQRLGLVETEQDVHRLYTPAMLAELLHVPVAVIRRWHRRGLIVPVREVRRLAYFDFREVATARRLAELLAAGTSPAAIERKLAALARYVPGVDRPLAQLSVIVEGKEILLRQGDGLIEPGGQLRFDFAAAEETALGEGLLTPPIAPTEGLPESLETFGPSRGTVARPHPSEPTHPSAAEAALAAAELEEAGQLDQAAEMVRAAMAAAGPTPEFCFQLAELLYRLGDPHGARERYYMAIELDEDYVEARANLGCVLAELGQHDLAVAALQGALAYHAEYADAHYHLARILDDLSRSPEAQTHWQAFLELAPDSPWADQARQRLGRP